MKTMLFVGTIFLALTAGGHTEDLHINDADSTVYVLSADEIGRYDNIYIDVPYLSFDGDSLDGCPPIITTAPWVKLQHCLFSLEPYETAVTLNSDSCQALKIGVVGGLQAFRVNGNGNTIQKSITERVTRECMYLDGNGNIIKNNILNGYQFGIYDVGIDNVKQDNQIGAPENYPSTPASVEQEKNPTSFTLFQNYPNPFNPATTIEFALPTPSQVTLTVVDSRGREVATLVDGEMQSGNHSVKFDAVNCAAGVYLYRLQAGDRVFQKKMTLMK